jgi:FtsH-binding integral membrane protein
MKDTDGNVNGISLNYKGGSAACASDPLRNYELIVNITCNLEVPLSNFIGQQGDGCV